MTLKETLNVFMKIFNIEELVEKATRMSKSEPNKAVYVHIIKACLSIINEVILW